MMTTPLAPEDVTTCPRCETPIALEQYQELEIRRHRDGRLELLGCRACPTSTPAAAAAC